LGGLFPDGTVFPAGFHPRVGISTGSLGRAQGFSGNILFSTGSQNISEYFAAVGVCVGSALQMAGNCFFLARLRDAAKRKD
jgi:hypothetical protein